MILKYFPSFVRKLNPPYKFILSICLMDFSLSEENISIFAMLTTSVEETYEAIESLVAVTIVSAKDNYP